MGHHAGAGDALIQHIIVHYWHPLGVSAMVKDPGKYDSFLKGLCEVVRIGASTTELAKYLAAPETSSRKVPPERERVILGVAQKICALETRMKEK